MYEFYSIILLMTILNLFILSLLVHENGRLTPRHKRSFYKTYIIIILAAIMEWIGIIMNGAPAWTRYIHSLVKVLDYTLSPAIAYFFIVSVDQDVIVKKYMGILEIIDIIFIIVSLPFGWVFYIDQGNVYHHGPYYVIYSVIYVLMMTMLIIGFLHYGRKFANSNKKSLFAITLFALAGIIFQETSGDFMRTGYLGLAMASSLLFIHYEEFCQQEMDEAGKEKSVLLEKDALTGLYSRYAYNEQLKKHREPPLSKTLCALLIDINGLKKVNDTLGHEKGDELIKEAANAIEIAASIHGKVYRTGGDEFVVILDLTSYTIKEFIKVMKKEFSVYRQNTDDALDIHVAVGYAKAVEYPNFTLEQLIEVADREMYKDKARFYRDYRIDRRHN
jgi:diguanylate cyclase (GGDEF)-like protein